MWLSVCRYDAAGSTLLVDEGWKLIVRSVRAEDARAQFSCSVLDSLTGERRRSAPAHIDITRKYNTYLSKLQLLNYDIPCISKHLLRLYAKWAKKCSDQGPLNSNYYWHYRTRRSIGAFTCEQISLNKEEISYLSSSSNHLKCVSDVTSNPSVCCSGERCVCASRYHAWPVGGLRSPRRRRAVAMSGARQPSTHYHVSTCKYAPLKT